MPTIRSARSASARLIAATWSRVAAEAGVAVSRSVRASAAWFTSPRRTATCASSTIMPLASASKRCTSISSTSSGSVEIAPDFS